MDATSNPHLLTREIEVDRAIENLFKSGKAFSNPPGRRESMPMAAHGRNFPDFGMHLDRIRGQAYTGRSAHGRTIETSFCR